jgi:catalase
MSDKPVMTTEAGRPIGDNQNSLTAGRRGPLLVEDVHLFEKLAHFNRERIPERVVHAKGSGAYGVFRVTNDITRFTSAALFQRIGKETPVFVRFSTVGGEKGSADTARDPRGFAVKFYTEEGNWDMVGNNTPTFFIRDPLKFPDLIHTQKRDPETNLKNPGVIWDYFSRQPESLHQVTILHSDRGTPDGYRFMHGFSSHTYSLINADGERVWVKWHFKSMQGVRNLEPAEAARIAGEDPDYAQRDLFEAIAAGEFPAWRVCVQVMSEVQAAALAFDPFDLTKVWPHRIAPLVEVGEMRLNRNPENYFAEVEQAAFSPGNIVPGMGYSPDRVLQGRLFAYADAHRYRLGVNHTQLPVNRPRCPMHNTNRDGAMRFDGNFGAAANYSAVDSDTVQPDPARREPALALEGPADRYDHRLENDDFTQAGDLFRLMSADQQRLLMDVIAGSLIQAPVEIQRRQLGHFAKADRAYGAGVAARLGLD